MPGPDLPPPAAPMTAEVLLARWPTAAQKAELGIVGCVAGSAACSRCTPQAVRRGHWGDRWQTAHSAARRCRALALEASPTATQA